MRLEIEHLRTDAYIGTQNYVYSFSKIQVNQLVISRPIYFKMPLLLLLTGFSIRSRTRIISQPPDTMSDYGLEPG